MPYIINTIPGDVKKFPKRLQRMWLHTYNSAYKQFKGNEKKAFTIANGVLKKYKETHSINHREQILDSLSDFLM